jgi:hypothetical protein
VRSGKPFDSAPYGCNILAGPQALIAQRDREIAFLQIIRTYLHVAVVAAAKCNRYGNRCVIANDPYDHASICPANHGIHRDLQHGF